MGKKKKKVPEDELSGDWMRRGIKIEKRWCAVKRGGRKVRKRLCAQ